MYSEHQHKGHNIKIKYTGRGWSYSIKGPRVKFCAWCHLIFFEKREQAFEASIKHIDTGVIASRKRFVPTTGRSNFIIKSKPKSIPIMSKSKNERTFGQIAVGLDFNPSGDDAVTLIKQKYADIIDVLHELRMTSTSNDVKRHCSTAITEAETAQMRAVKALTWKDYVPPAIDFKTEVVERSKEVPVLIDFYMDSCQPCHVIAPKLKILASEKGFDLVKVDARAEKELAKLFNVTGVPRLLFYKDGEPVWDSGDESWPGTMGILKRVEKIVEDGYVVEATEDIKGEQFERDIRE